MRLDPALRDWLLATFGARLDAGGIVIYEGNPQTDPAAAVLVTLAFDSPAFGPVENGRIEAREIAPALITQTGEAGWADLITAGGEVVALTRVMAVDDPNIEDGTILVDRRDFHRGGLCTLSRLTWALPLS